MTNVSINIVKLKEDAVIPNYQTEQAAGMDLHACINEPIVLQPLERVMIPTGFAIELPVGYEAQIRARSGMSIKYGITMVNGIGTIDADYRGEIGILTINLSNQPFTIEPEMRIAQMVIAKYECIDWNEVKFISETERGVGGYGSTGVKS